MSKNSDPRILVAASWEGFVGRCLVMWKLKAFYTVVFGPSFHMYTRHSPDMLYFKQIENYRQWSLKSYSWSLGEAFCIVHKCKMDLLYCTIWIYAYITYIESIGIMTILWLIWNTGCRSNFLRLFPVRHFLIKNG